MNIESRKVNTESKKANIEEYIEAEKANIEVKKVNIEDRPAPGTAVHIQRLLAVLGLNTAFGRPDVHRLGAGADLPGAEGGWMRNCRTE